MTEELKGEPEGRTDEPEALLYHYTNLAAFQSIVENGKLWATHIRYLNDTSEQRLFAQLLRKRVSVLIETAPSEDKQRYLLFQERVKPKTVYLFCFSQDDGNRLSQWRGYAAQGGVSIGFRPSRLRSLCKRMPAHLSLQKVHYVNPDAGRDTDHRLDKVLQLDFSAPGSPNFGFFTDWVSLVWGTGFKHLAFIEENETRIVLQAWGETPVKHRVRGSLMVPYLELDIRQHSYDLVEQVIVGPNPHQEQTAESIKNLLKENGWTSVAVTCSSTPYRCW